MSNANDNASVYEPLTKHLAESQYTFVCPSPESAGRVVKKRLSDASTADAQNATDFFGWSLPCTRYVTCYSSSSSRS